MPNDHKSILKSFEREVVSSIDPHVRTHTALHIVKGAARRVLGTKWTASVFVEGKHGRLTLQCQQQPTDADITEVERLANEKIAANTAIEQINMLREEAEKRWGDEIYDLFPLPAGITRLQILNIPDWNVNACKAVHTTSTGEVGKIKIGGARFRAAKQLLELPFDLES